ncbi:MAG: hypothetical protein KAI47_27850, partial [Deltaproteobacteria bacterium]|nr:hypothetical protein [Deltaproteobacteria bacterium]
MNPPPPKPADDALAHPRAAATLAVRDSLDPAAPYADQTALQTLLRRTLADYGLVGDAPLGQIIPPGARVLLKPNWVLHKNQGSGPLAAVVTAPELLVALLGELARTDATHITLADAPVQGCDFDRLVTDDFRHAARAALRPDQKLEILDLRRTLLESPDVPGGVEADARSHERYALFDLRDKSLLESVTGPNAFRVTMY